jgi:hypothetical protein
MQDVGEAQRAGAGLAQSIMGSVHIDRHAVPVASQANPSGHGADDPVRQLPAPLQKSACFRLLPVQLAAPHETVGAACVQAFMPLQVPVFPQGGAAVQVVAGTGASPALRLWQAVLPAHVWQPAHVVVVGVEQFPPAPQELAAVNVDPSAEHVCPGHVAVRQQTLFTHATLPPPH